MNTDSNSDLDDTGATYQQLCETILKTAKTSLPDKVYSPSKAGGVSDHIKALFQKRSDATRQNTTPAQLKSIQNEIKKSSLQDYKDWVDENVSTMEKENVIGDTNTQNIHTRETLKQES